MRRIALFLLLSFLILLPVTVVSGTSVTATYPVAPTESKKALKALPELKVAYDKKKVLHILAYVREYSTMTTYGDSIFLFREKWVDYMIPNNGVKRYKGWTTPRVIATNSYYHFTDGRGLDSVSDRYYQSFSWADWVSIINGLPMPPKIARNPISTDTINSPLGISQIWERNEDDLSVKVDVLADTLNCTRWIPDIKLFFQTNTLFEDIKVEYSFTDLITDHLYARDIDCIKVDIKSEGRGKNMFRFNRRDESFLVSTTTEVYMYDKDYITVKDAKKWEHDLVRVLDEYDLQYPLNLPPLSSDIQNLMARVDAIDHTPIRLATFIDPRIAGRDLRPMTFKRSLQAIFSHDPYEYERRALRPR